VINLLVALLHGEPPAEQQILLPPELVIRESSLGYELPREIRSTADNAARP